MSGFIVFDCDGTIVDSQFMIVAAMKAAFDTKNLPYPDERAVRRVVGLSLDEAIWRLVPDADRGTILDLADAYKWSFRDARAGGGREPFYAGAREAIERLSATGYLLGIATGKSRRGLLSVLEQAGLMSHFVSLQTADDAPGKPHPGMLQQAMREAGADAAKTIMIGDTSYDMEMARNAGVAGLGVSWGYHGVEELRAAGAKFVVDDYPELERQIPKLLSETIA